MAEQLHHFLRVFETFVYESPSIVSKRILLNMALG